MAEDTTSQEKSLEPTQRRLDDAKEKGDFARSREVTTVFIFSVMLVFLFLAQDYMIRQISGTARFFFRFDSLIDLSPATANEFFWMVLVRLGAVVLPLLAIVFVTAIGAETAQVGVRVVKDPFEPKWDRLNPVKGLKRIFSLRQFAEGVKSVIKLFIVAYISYLTIRGSMPIIANMTGNTPAQGLHIMLSIGFKLGFRVCIVLVFFAGFDYWFQRWQYYKKLRMSHQEMKDEIKDREGDPVLKARIRSIQLEIARKRMMSDVPDADVVITNPIHYAIALRYDPAKSHAPLVVAKGQNLIARKIREVAEEAGVPIVEDPTVARALYKRVTVGAAIPANLFQAVAGILASIWHLAQKRERTWAASR